MSLRAVVESNEGGGFTVRILNLPGCVSEGRTLDEAMSNLARMMDLRREETRAA